MLNNFVEPIRRFLEKRRMHAELKQLRASGELDRILDEADYKMIRGDQGSDYVNIYHKKNITRGSELFSALFSEKDEAIWWIVKRYREEKAGVGETTNSSQHG